MNNLSRWFFKWWHRRHERRFLRTCQRLRKATSAHRKAKAMLSRHFRQGADVSRLDARSFSATSSGWPSMSDGYAWRGEGFECTIQIENQRSS